MNEMKQSGIPYIWEIPKNWEVKRNKNLLRVSKRIVGENFNKYQLLSLTKRGIVEKDITQGGGKQPDTFATYQAVEKDNLVMCLFDLDCSAVFVGMSNYNGMISPAYDVFYPKENVNIKYYEYLFRYIENERCYVSQSTSLRFVLSDVQFGWIRQIQPPIATQNRIVAYLDKHTAIIDKQIEANKKAIALLGEYRASAIDAKMQPKNTWKIEPLKLHFDFGKGLSITKEDLVEDGLPVISYGQVHSKDNLGTTITDDLIKFVPESFLENKNSLVNKDDFIFADTSEDLEGIGNCVYVDRNETLFAGYHTIILKARGKNNKFFAYLFKSDYWRRQLRSMAYGTKVYSVTQTMLRQIKIYIPPNEEQKEIIASLDKMCKRVDRIIAYRKAIIEKLEEYKKSLIYEAVTGKKEIV